MSNDTDKIRLASAPAFDRFWHACGVSVLTFAPCFDIIKFSYAETLKVQNHLLAQTEENFQTMRYSRCMRGWATSLCQPVGCLGQKKSRLIWEEKTRDI